MALHVVHGHALPDHRRLDAVGVRGQQLRPAEALPPHPGRAPSSPPSSSAVQAEDLAGQAAPAVRRQPLLALAARPRLLLVVGRRRLVQGVDVEGVAQVRVRVTGLRVGDGLVGGREVRRLEVGAGRVREGGRRAVQVLADRRQVGQPRVAIAAAVVSLLEDGGPLVQLGQSNILGILLPTRKALHFVGLSLYFCLFWFLFKYEQLPK